LLSQLLNKPYYLFRPGQALRRFRRALAGGPAGGRESVLLPWGLPITVDSMQPIGSALLRSGVYDLCVCEAVYRLADEGELAIDAGANIGLMTSVAAVKLGRSGKVLAFEPHPTTFEELLANAERWGATGWVAEVEPKRLALSDHDGQATLAGGDGSDLGRASLASPAGAGNGRWEAEVRRLDSLVSGDVGVLKLDIEGHEASALKGAEELVRARKIRDIVFEEHHTPPTPATEYLERNGYEVFRLEQRLLGLRLSDSPKAGTKDAYFAPSYLATLDPDRARARLRARGWMVLSAGRRTPGPDRTSS
jgi:FkbM family methyltransferase